MSAAEEMTVSRPGFISRFFRLIFNMLIGALLCLTPVTAIIVLGWLRRRMAAIINAEGTRPQTTGWIMGAHGEGRLSRLLGGLGANIRDGFQTAVSLAIVALPFGAIWALAWWSGWTNSFTKGYEQAAVGPVVFAAGTAIFVIVWVHLPMALAHQAAEGRLLALFDIKAIRNAVRKSGWRYVWLFLTTLFFTLPLFASRGLVTFASGIFGDVETMSPDGPAPSVNAPKRSGKWPFQQRRPTGQRPPAHIPW